jgi:hypothetical protein
MMPIFRGSLARFGCRRTGGRRLCQRQQDTESMRQNACGSRKQRPLWNGRIYCELPGLGSQSQSRRSGALFPKRPTKVFTRRSVGDVSVREHNSARSRTSPRWAGCCSDLLKRADRLVQVEQSLLRSGPHKQPCVVMRHCITVPLVRCAEKFLWQSLQRSRFFLSRE